MINIFTIFSIPLFILFVRCSYIDPEEIGKAEEPENFESEPAEPDVPQPEAPEPEAPQPEAPEPDPEPLCLDPETYAYIHPHPSPGYYYIPMSANVYLDLPAYWTTNSEIWVMYEQCNWFRRYTRVPTDGSEYVRLQFRWYHTLGSNVQIRIAVGYRCSGRYCTVYSGTVYDKEKKWVYSFDHYLPAPPSMADVRIVSVTDSGVVLKNFSSYTAEISHWSLGSSDSVADNYQFEIPSNTFLDPSETITFSSSKLGFTITNLGEKIYLYNKDQEIVDTRIIY
jgi:hypothetical protein